MVARQAWNKGRPWPEATKKRISKSRKGITAWNKGKKGVMPEPWNKGKSWSEDVKKKISKSKKGTISWNKGKPWSDEVKQKISMSRNGQPAWNKGRPWAKEVRKKISRSKAGQQAWNKGLTWSDETVAKISASKKGQVPWNKGRSWPAIVKKKISRSKLAITMDLKPFYDRNRPSKRLNTLVMSRDGYKCVMCGKTGKETILEVDHIVSVSKGGKTTLDNLQTLCFDHNRGKADLDIRLPE